MINIADKLIDKSQFFIEAYFRFKYHELYLKYADRLMYLVCCAVFWLVIGMVVRCFINAMAKCEIAQHENKNKY